MYEQKINEDMLAEAIIRAKEKAAALNNIEDDGPFNFSNPVISAKYGEKAIKNACEKAGLSCELEYPYKTGYIIRGCVQGNCNKVLRMAKCVVDSLNADGYFSWLHYFSD